MPDLARRCLAEFVGTFLLVFVGVGAIASDAAFGGLGPVGVALAFGGVVAVMVHAVGHLSGAHLNPAVTLGFTGIGLFPRTELPAYVAAQLLGATMASGALHVSVGLHGGLGATQPAVALGGALLIEVVITFTLMFVIVAVASDERAPTNLAGVAIGLAVMTGALAGGPLTGGSMNPARSLGPALFGGAWTAHWLYWVAPCSGALLGAHSYQWIRSAPEVPGPDLRR